ncbi:MAG: GntR family transcriptional regulator [Flavobacteriales bacterium]|jgi:predicted RNA-binding protein (virulence factor B family)|nr:GntR family transcriptional regulator [Flavobacteriales bacterium]MBK6892307.1 GntR family transcriptional regulator [Flavobacteriales bacterium]MBK7246442.1 GntR family transcriptional regulator [Flavobacteriales bacterium]MBK7285963.1 GntR family transcriptional regulator [Flavobacteriales bacterium]MBK9060615.1 GntR family transcriptional regulator [Flavobacteriales bacterium]
MIHTGQTQDLVILRNTSVGLFLGDGEGNEVLLPNKYVPAEHDQGSTLSVFVYRDSEDRQVATTLEPRIQLNGFASLRTFAVDRLGAFMDWGMEKHLLVPFKEQQKKLEEGRWYVTYMALDEQTDRLYGSTRIDKHLDNSELSVAEGDAVELLVFGRSEMGWSVIVNDKHQGLVHANDVFKPISMGDRISGFVKTVRTDNKLDITLQPIGYDHYNDANVVLLARRLKQHEGFLPLTDKSSPEEIYRVFGISKKAFKKALGALYKERKVRIEEQGIVWVGEVERT